MYNEIASLDWRFGSDLYGSQLRNNKLASLSTWIRESIMLIYSLPFLYSYMDFFYSVLNLRSHGFHLLVSTPYLLIVVAMGYTRQILYYWYNP